MSFLPRFMSSSPMENDDELNGDIYLSFFNLFSLWSRGAKRAKNSLKLEKYESIPSFSI